MACESAEGSPSPGGGAIAMGLFSPTPADFAALRADGFTMVGPWYVPAPDRALLDAAAAAGLGVVFPVGYDNQRYGREHRIGWDEETTRTEIAAAIDAVADHGAIVAWYLMPEELRYWRADEVAYMALAREMIRARDPQARPILGYQPNDRDADQLTAGAAAFDIVSKGVYANFVGYHDRRAWVRWSTAELRAAAGPDRPVWVMPEMFADPQGATAGDVAAWARHDVLAAVLGGADGILVYSGWRRPGFGAFDAYRAAYGAVARELNGDGGLAGVLRAGVRCHAHEVEVVGGPAEVDFTAAGRGHTWPSVASVELHTDDGRWLWIVNSAADPVTVRVRPRFDGTLASGAAYAVAVDDRLWIAPWGVVGLRAPPDHSRSDKRSPRPR